MSGPPRYHPSRRSRFRAQDPGFARPVDSAPVDPADPDATVADPAAVPEYESSLSMPVADLGAPVPETVPEAFSAQVFTPAAATLDEALLTEGPTSDLKLPTMPIEEVDELPRAFQLRNVYEGQAPQRRSLMAFYVTLGSLFLLGIGLTTGYLFGSRGRVARTVVLPGVAALPGKAVEPSAISADTQAAVDAAFSATKERRYDDAKKQFAALHDAHPEWPSMAIESARATLYQLDAQATGAILLALTRYGPQPDAEFMQALLHMTHKEYEPANRSFGAAVALDPARPDFYYFWGECLRDQGKPREAAEKFRAALLRNQYETSEDLYQLKFWLSLIQADQEETSGTNAKIDAALGTAPRPPFSAVFAAAAREIKAGRFEEAAKYFAQAQQFTEPVVFRVVIQDPTFVQESWRPELQKFYK